MIGGVEAGIARLGLRLVSARTTALRPRACAHQPPRRQYPAAMPAHSWFHEAAAATYDADVARIEGGLRERWADWSQTPFTSSSRSHVSVWEKRVTAAPCAQRRDTP